MPGARARRAGAGLAAALSAGGLAGCGFGPGPGSADVTLRVTRDFGTRPVAAVHDARVPGAETVMRLLERHLRVVTSYGGRFVTSISGLGGGGVRRDWFFYVGGRESGRGAADVPVRRGQRIWWDLHDWSAAETIPAVVGQWPAPFAGASAALECAAPGATCRAAGAALRRAGARLGRGGGPRAEVGVRHRALRGPAANGIYARDVSGGIELLDPRGRAVRRLAAGEGLIAATMVAGEPVWILTGTDERGLAAAVRALRERELASRFAVAISAAGVPTPLPMRPAS